MAEAIRFAIPMPAEPPKEQDALVFEFASCDFQGIESPASAIPAVP